MATLSTANSALSLAVLGLFPVPQAMQGYATDDSIATDDVNPAEVMMGVDGKLSAGFTPYATVQTYMFQADSPSLAFWDTILEAQKARNETLELFGTLNIQGIEKKYALVKGFITSATPAPTSKKVLQPRKFVVTWQSVTPAPN